MTPASSLTDSQRVRQAIASSRHWSLYGAQTTSMMRLTRSDAGGAQEIFLHFAIGGTLQSGFIQTATYVPRDPALGGSQQETRELVWSRNSRTFDATACAVVLDILTEDDPV